MTTDAGRDMVILLWRCRELDPLIHISTSAPSSITRSGGMRKNSVGRVAMRARLE